MDNRVAAEAFSEGLNYLARIVIEDDDEPTESLGDLYEMRRALQSIRDGNFRTNIVPTDEVCSWLDDLIATMESRPAGAPISSIDRDLALRVLRHFGVSAPT